PVTAPTHPRPPNQPASQPPYPTPVLSVQPSLPRCPPPPLPLSDLPSPIVHRPHASYTPSISSSHCCSLISVKRKENRPLPAPRCTHAPGKNSIRTQHNTDADINILNIVTIINVLVTCCAPSSPSSSLSAARSPPTGFIQPTSKTAHPTPSPAIPVAPSN
ncbi:hypothetical protein EX30DRAFT_57312, partial [Ascodesmis nigricans]